MRLTAADAARLAKAARQSVSVQMAQGLDLTAWAPDGLVIDLPIWRAERRNQRQRGPFCDLYMDNVTRLMTKGGSPFLSDVSQAPECRQ